MAVCGPWISPRSRLIGNLAGSASSGQLGLGFLYRASSFGASGSSSSGALTTRCSEPDAVTFREFA